MKPDNYMAESAKAYIDQYKDRLANFLDAFEATAEDFILKEIEKFSAATDDYEHYFSLERGGQFGAPESYWMAQEAIDALGYDQVYYSSKRKIEFLNQQKNILSGQNAPTINTGSINDGRSVPNQVMFTNTIDFTESAEFYINCYERRAAQFIAEFASSEINFVMRQAASIRDSMEDYELCKHYPNPLEYDFRGGDGLKNVVHAVEKIGYDRYYDWNKQKIEFLKQRGAELITNQASTSRDINSSQDDAALMTIKSMKAKAIVPSTPMEDIVNHFLPMTKIKNGNGDPFLTKGQLCIFLKRAFMEDHTQPQQKINCPAGEKGFVVKRFYEFYKKAKNDYAALDRKGPFIDLFMDCFSNWDRSTVESLFRGNKTRKKWE